MPCRNDLPYGLRSLFPDAEIEALAGAGHRLHAEQPEAFLGKVEGWLLGL